MHRYGEPDMNELIARLAPTNRKLVWDLFDGARVVVTVTFFRTPSKDALPWEAEIRGGSGSATPPGYGQGQGHSKGAALDQALALLPAAIATKRPPIDWAGVKAALGKAGAFQA